MNAYIASCLMNYSNIQIRTATADNLTAIQSCAQSAYGIYVERMGIEPAPIKN